MDLKPTLWRTCRVLASTPRLQLIRALLEKGTASVSTLSARAGLSPSKGSIHLRALNSRGLISATPKGRFVFYTPVPNPSVAGAAQILTALKVAISADMNDDEIIHYTTAFTHQRRIVMVKALEERGCEPVELSSLTRIPLPALLRHAEKLRARDMISDRKHTLKLRIPQNLFGHAMLESALKS
ncbi:ArsR family transcriptional regulator [Verrucomicrobia bacterium S94]|nr:ArsR family transcriptional regulator [Verrucomicrobia bacterium S94]